MGHSGYQAHTIRPLEQIYMFIAIMLHARKVWSVAPVEVFLFYRGIWCWNLHTQLFNITLRQNILIKKGFSGPGDKLSFLFLGMFGWNFDVCELPINAINTSLFRKIYTKIFLWGLSHEFCNSFIVFLYRAI